MAAADIEVFFKATPNPHALKFYFTKEIAHKTLHIASLQEAKGSPLAQRLFGFPWVKGVFIGRDFVSITKQDWVEWSMLTRALCDLLAEYAAKDQVWSKEPPSPQPAAGASTDAAPQPSPHAAATEHYAQLKGADLERAVKEVLAQDIRPALAMDGGDADFNSLSDSGVLRLKMQGACVGCPSLHMTLQEGVERHMRKLFPQITRVEAIQ